MRKILFLFCAIFTLFVHTGLVRSQLKPVRGATWTGQFSISVDGNGTAESEGTIQVNKPPDATVQAAYLIAAATWKKTLPNGSILLEGQSIKWDKTFTGAGSTENGWADVTSIVAPIINAAPEGLIAIDVAESNSRDVDGEILVVVFNDPNSLLNNTMILLFGGQAVEGETFRINLAEPIDLIDKETRVHMGLGISYSAQNYSKQQYSVIEINGKRLTTSAGGRDDGELAEGALLTVGGIGDSFRNPARPSRIPVNDFTDDELYDLLPFVKDGDDLISVFTRNPSNDDNIFFAWFESSVPAAIGESVILTPPASEGAMGLNHSLVATLNNNRGRAIANREVTFEVVGGVNKGKTAKIRSNKKGHAVWSYSGMVTGVDSIEARFFSPLTDETMYSNIVSKRWISLEVSPNHLDYDSVSVSFASSKELTLMNKDDSLSYNLEFVCPEGFSSSLDSLILSPQERESLSVTFTPDSVVEYREKLLIKDRDTGKRLGVIPLTGTGYIKPPQIAFSDSVLDFGRVRKNSARKLMLGLSNTVENSILEARMSLGDSTFSVSPDSLTIRSANSQEIEIVFKPLIIGEYNADLLIVSNSKNQALQRIRLTGMGVKRTLLSYWPFALGLGLPASIIIILVFRRRKQNGDEEMAETENTAV